MRKSNDIKINNLKYFLKDLEVHNLVIARVLDYGLKEVPVIIETIKEL